MIPAFGIRGFAGEQARQDVTIVIICDHYGLVEAAGQRAGNAVMIFIIFFPIQAVWAAAFFDELGYIRRAQGGGQSGFVLAGLG